MRFPPARIVSLVGVLMALVLAAPAGATTLVGGGLQRYQTLADHVLVPTPPGAVTVNLSACPGGAEWSTACAVPEQRTIYLGTGGRSAATFLHELGHIFDATVLTPAARTQFQLIIARPGAWMGDPTLSPPNEQFAEAYALCARHARLRERYFASYDYAPTPAQHARVCAVIRRAA